MNDTFRESAKDDPNSQPAFKGEELEELPEEANEDEDADEDGSPAKPTKAPVPPIKKIKTNLCSPQDKMIEIKWNQSVIQSSATVLCFSNFNESTVTIAMIDLKTRRKNIFKSFKTEFRPTFLFQIDENNLLVGTEGGQVEHLVIDDGKCKQTFNTFPGSEKGVSQILEIQSQSSLLRGKD